MVIWQGRADVVRQAASDPDTGGGRGTTRRSRGRPSVWSPPDTPPDQIRTIVEFPVAKVAAPIG